jgi:hypothetical protein
MRRFVRLVFLALLSCGVLCSPLPSRERIQELRTGEFARLLDLFGPAWLDSSEAKASQFTCQEFTSNGTWTPQGGQSWVVVAGCGGGGGGGGGPGGPAGSTTANVGGGGGGAGPWRNAAVPVTPGTGQSVVVGGGGTHGTGGTGTNGAGVAGSSGSNSGFGSLVTFPGGGGGAPGGTGNCQPNCGYSGCPAAVGNVTTLSGLLLTIPGCGGPGTNVGSASSGFAPDIQLATTVGGTGGTTGTTSTNAGGGGGGGGGAGALGSGGNGGNGPNGTSGATGTTGANGTTPSANTCAAGGGGSAGGGAATTGGTGATGTSGASGDVRVCWGQ